MIQEESARHSDETSLNRPTRWYDYITINIYYFALTSRAQVLTPLIIPLLVQHFVGEGAKGAYYGTMRLWALMVAILTQSLMGAVSDRSTHPWGRRRPFILVGTLGGVVVTALIGLASGLEGMTGYWVLFGLYVLSMLASDTAHAATQGLIPDLVPEEKRGLFSGFKALLEVPVPLIFISLIVSQQVARGDMWGALIAVMVVLVVCMLVTMLVREERQERPPYDLQRGTVLRLFVMTGAFAGIILVVGAGVSALLRFADMLEGSRSLALIAILGILGMAVAVVVGVWVSVWISVGRGIRHDPSFVWWVINRLSFMLASSGLSAFMLYFMQERYPGFEGERAAGPAATAMVCVGVCILLTAVPAGWLADRVNKKVLVAISSITATGGMAVVLLVPQLAAFYIGGSLVGVGIGLFYAAQWALGTQIVPSGQAGRYLGLANLAGAGAGAIGAYIGGPIADRSSFVLLFAVYASMFLLSVLALGGIRERATA